MEETKEVAVKYIGPWMKAQGCRWHAQETAMIEVSRFIELNAKIKLYTSKARGLRTHKMEIWFGEYVKTILNFGMQDEPRCIQ